MKKLAIFVEGLTEQLFLEKLIFELCSKNNITVDLFQNSGPMGQRRIRAITLSPPNFKGKYYIAIYDCRGDDTVKSDILENLKTLTKANFEAVIGLNDVYPRDLTSVKLYLNYYIPTAGIPIKMMLSIMEIEAWFIAEENHYANISPKLTMEKIKAVLGLDICAIDVETIAWPADTLNSIYQIENMTYLVKNKASKKGSKIRRTVNAIDYSNLYFNVRKRVPALDKLLQELETFLT
jgi:chorismate mutase